MNPFTLLLLFGLIFLSDEVLNGQLRLSQRLLQRLEQVEKKQKSETR